METPQFVKSLNSWRTNEYNIDIATYVPKFHIPSKSLYSTSNSLNYDCKIVPGELINIDIDTNQTDKFKKQLSPSAIEQNDSNEWIRKYGLSTHKLTLDQILSMIGFKHSEEYLGNVKKYITSKYSQGLFLQTISKNGTTYNITCNHVKLADYIDRLKDSINLYKQRLQWLNTDSRRIFGVLVNYNVCLVLDVKQTDNKKFFHYCQSVIKLLREQVSKLRKFNIIRYTNQIETFKEKLIAVSNDTIEEAIDWMNKWDFHSISITNTTSTCEASLLAFNFDQVDGVYLLSESNSPNGSREILFDLATKESFKKKVPFHVISYNCNDSQTIEYLNRLAVSSYGPGRFHAYSLLKEIDHYDSGPIDRDPTKSQVIQHKRQFGGTPPGAGVRNDIILVFEQLQQATETVEHLNSILNAMTSRKANNSTTSSSAFFANSSSSIISESTKSQTQTKIDEEALSSADWLKINGLGARKMELFDVLAHVAFRHCDGVVNIKQPPISGVGDSIPRDKIVNAKYCDTFAHVLWNDGTIRHVHVTPEIHRYYQSNLKIYLDQIERRIEWLSKGSRELFGTVIENNIYILIDVSQSMQISLDFVKQKLVALMQEQLKSKQRFNLVAFNNKVFSWRDRLVEVDEHNFNEAWKWIKTLTAQGTTNTLGAIRFALSDLNTEAIYLVTDGRPDQSPRHILSQVQLNKKVPIHTISFNCNDSEANHFLFQLARETGGRYHYFNENFWAADPDGPIPYESEDIRLLKEELEKGSKYLSQVEALRDECTKLSYLIRSNKSEKCSKDHSEKERPLKRTPEQLEVIEQFTKLRNSKSSSFADLRISNMKHEIVETDKSLLLSLSTRRSDWILPETKDYLERQIERQSKINKEYEALTKSAPPVPAPRFKRQKPKSVKKPAEKDLPIKKWIKMNSLAALHLTIIDAIGPTLVKQKPAYIEVLDTYVTSKVWNEIFPYTNVSNRGKNELRIVNPRKTDLEKYEENLKKQIVIYKTYLTETIWKALSERDPENFDINRPTEFDAYSEHSLLKHLEKFDWPVKLEEINIIKKEIELAERYLQQSRDLRDAILSKEEVVEKEQKRMAEKSASKGNNGKEISEGESIIARRDSNGYYFDAVVTKVVDSRHINIRFLNGDVQEHVPILFVIRCNNTNTRSHLDLGDYVMALVLNESRERCYVPGIVQSVDSSASPKQFTVLYFNGMEGVNVRNELITINKNRYGLAANYIRNKMGLTNNLATVRKNDTEASQNTQTETDEFLKAGVDQLKEDIVDSLKDHLDKMKLDENYKKLVEELEKSKQKRKKEKETMKKEIKELKKTLKEMKKKQKSKEKEEDELDGLDRVTPVRAKTPVKELQPRPPTIAEELEKMRRSLGDLTVGEEVLAKWSDDGWYYRSVVKEYCGNYKYKIEDTMRIIEEIYRENIISESDAAENNLLELHDTVIALHPNFAFSYAPGVIIKVANNLTVVIRFYDGQQATVSKEEVYKIPLFKFEYDVDTIIKLEKRWVGETVVAKNAFTFVYELGKIKERIGDGKQYAIEWSDGKVSVQNSIDIFGSFTKMPPIVVNDYVLAPPNEVFYLPGRVTGTRGKNFIVAFVDGTTHDNISPDNCIWLSRSYYEYAYNFYRRKFQSNTN